MWNGFLFWFMYGIKCRKNRFGLEGGLCGTGFWGAGCMVLLRICKGNKMKIWVSERVGKAFGFDFGSM